MEVQIGLNLWVCPPCYKKFSSNYRYKSHLTRCLSFKPTSGHHQQALFEIKNDLRSELANMFRDATYEFKEELKSSAKSVEPLVKKPYWQYL